MHPGHFFNEPLAQEILRISLSLCDESYLVGGCIRDTLIGNHQISDLDIAVEGDGFQIAREVTDKLSVKASFVALDKDRRTGRIVVSKPPHDGGYLLFQRPNHNPGSLSQGFHDKLNRCASVGRHQWKSL